MRSTGDSSNREVSQAWDHWNFDSGTVLEDRQLEASSNHFILAMDIDKDIPVASWLDLSTGKFILMKSSNIQDFFSVLSSLSPPRSNPSRRNGIKSSPR